MKRLSRTFVTNIVKYLLKKLREYGHESHEIFYNELDKMFVDISLSLLTVWV